MEDAKKILLVTNATTDNEINQIKEALIQAKNQGLNLKMTLVHVIPHLPGCYFNIPSMVMLAEQYYNEAKKNLSTIGEKLDIATKDQWLVTGRMKAEALRLANKLNVQFILAGSASIQDLHQSLTKKEGALSIKSINNIETI